MVLAELVSSGELIERGELAPVDGNALLPVRLEGVRLNAGVGIGQAVMHDAGIVIRHLVAENPDAEAERLKQGLDRLRSDLDELLESQDLPAASIAKCWKPSACSPTTPAGSGVSARPFVRA